MRFLTLSLVVGASVGCNLIQKGSSGGSSAKSGDYQVYMLQGPYPDQVIKDLNIDDVEFSIESITVLKSDGTEVEVDAPKTANDLLASRFLKGKATVGGFVIPKGEYSSLRVNLKKYPVLHLQNEDGEVTRVVTKELLSIPLPKSISSSGVSFEIGLDTNFSLPLSTLNFKALQATAKEEDKVEKKQSVTQNQLGCDFVAAIKAGSKYTVFDTVGEAVADAETGDTILIGDLAANTNMHLSEVNGVEIKDACDVTLNSLHIQKSQDLVVSGFSIKPKTMGVHAVMVQGSAMLNKNVTLANLTLPDRVTSGIPENR